MDLAGLGDDHGEEGLLSTENLLHDVLGSLNARELAQRRFREIARIAGLVFAGYPGAPKALRQIQASSSLFYEVFRKYDSGNRLLAQSETEVLAQELEIGRLAATLARMRTQRVELVELKVPSPFALPLMVERFREQLTTEKLAERLERILREADKALGLPVAPAAPRRPGALRESPAPGRRRRRSQADGGGG
jgi:ATP-dependent Lhr-like helicase